MEITPCIARVFAIHINYFKYMNSKTKKRVCQNANIILMILQFETIQ